MRVFLLSLGHFCTTTPVQNGHPFLPKTSSPLTISSLIISTLLSNSKVLLEVGMLELLELLLVHLGLLVVYVDDTLDDLETVFHIVH